MFVTSKEGIKTNRCNIGVSKHGCYYCGYNDYMRKMSAAKDVWYYGYIKKVHQKDIELCNVCESARVRRRYADIAMQ